MKCLYTWKGLAFVGAVVGIIVLCVGAYKYNLDRTRERIPREQQAFDSLRLKTTNILDKDNLVFNCGPYQDDKFECHVTAINKRTMLTLECVDPVSKWVTDTSCHIVHVKSIN